MKERFKIELGEMINSAPKKKVLSHDEFKKFIILNDNIKLYSEEDFNGLHIPKLIRDNLANITVKNHPYIKDEKELRSMIKKATGCNFVIDDNCELACVDIKDNIIEFAFAINDSIFYKSDSFMVRVKDKSDIDDLIEIKKRNYYLFTYNSLFSKEFESNNFYKLINQFKIFNDYYISFDNVKDLSELDNVGLPKELYRHWVPNKTVAFIEHIDEEDEYEF